MRVDCLISRYTTTQTAYLVFERSTADVHCESEMLAAHWKAGLIKITELSTSVYSKSNLMAVHVRKHWKKYLFGGLVSVFAGRWGTKRYR